MPDCFILAFFLLFEVLCLICLLVCQVAPLPHSPLRHVGEDRPPLANAGAENSNPIKGTMAFSLSLDAAFK